ncbi:MAG TPA: LuxR C-terminal-related transcriptional regulator [Acidimicrobiia bacterium]|nr:LuxR C-terminal-related transcriptional regulator [Acidimicrobiia bacterium]
MIGPIRVEVYDPNEIFRRGVVSCLHEDPMLQVVAHDACFSEGGFPPDVAIVSALAAAVPNCPLVACVDQSVGLRSVAWETKVFAVLARRSLAPEQLVSAVRAAAVGLRITDSAVMTPDFDQRSLAVLRMLAEGAAVREISDSLGWSERTIKGVIAAVQREFQARTRTQAVAEALRRELI